jgi:cell division protein FtsB
MSKKLTEQEIACLKLQVKALQKSLGAFIAWTAQSSLGVIRPDEASTLLNWMNGHD